MTSADPDILKTLPPVLRSIVRALGMPRAREWLLDHGGVTVSLPIYQTRALGLSPQELARLRESLALHLDANNRIWLPKADKLLRHARNQTIRKERGRDSINTLARNWRLSSRQIVNICKDTEDAQPSLF